MLGKNVILPPKKSDGNNLDINSIFATFQGEGIYTGFPAIFIRLSGCNLACKFCDTEFDNYKTMTVDKIIEQVKKLDSTKKSNSDNIVVITGGEPMRQNIKVLCKELINNHFIVQIETNGSIFQDLPEQVQIVCSPKTNNGINYQLNKDILPRISAFKFLISSSNKNYQTIPELGQTKFKIPTYLQPIDDYNKKQNEANQKLTLELAKKHGYRISLQTHKFWGIE